MPHIKDYTGKRAHMIGIGGSSMCGLAGLLVKLGARVTGSDSGSATYDSYHVRAGAVEGGIDVFIGQRPGKRGRRGSGHLSPLAIAPDNPGAACDAEELGIPQMERCDAAGAADGGLSLTPSASAARTAKPPPLPCSSKVIVDCRAWIPPCISAASCDYIGGSTRRGRGMTVFVAEACEFNASFLHFHPTMADRRSTFEEDHLDYL